MKKITTSILVLAIASVTIQNAQAQTNTFPATGNVGIGTIAPASKLDILPANGNALTIRPYGAAANNTGQLQFKELAANGANYVGIRAPDALASNLIFRLPTAYGTNGQVLGTTGSGVLTWVAAGGGASTSLNNLTATSINMSLVAGTNNTRDLGTAPKAWRNIYVTGIYPRTAGTLGFGITPTGSLATFANLDIVDVTSNGSLQIGASNTSNLVMDNNEIQARLNDSPTDLYLNYQGGTTHLGSNEPFAYTEVLNPIYMNTTASVYGKFGIKTTNPQFDLHLPSSDYTAAKIGTPYVGGTAVIIEATASSGNTWALYASAPLSGYAGYFSGHVFCSGTYVGSDERLKENIQPLHNALDKIMKLDVRTYNFKQDYEKMHLPTGVQNGFIAQNLETVFPGLVKETADKSVDKDHPIEFKAVNYTGMIPVLTAAIQEQNHNTDELRRQNERLQQRLDEMEHALQNCCSNYAPAQKTSEAITNPGGQLLQNTPNPFNTRTVISYTLPANTSTASVSVYNMNGDLVRSYDALNTAGKIIIQPGELSSGNYTYHLIVNGNSVDSKLMTLTK